MHLTDEEIVSQCFENKELFSVLYERYQFKLRSFLYGRFHLTTEETEDILQDAFVKAYVGLRTFKKERKFKTWLYAIAINTAYTFLRIQKTEDILDYENILCADVEEYGDYKEDIYITKKALLALKDEHREVLSLHYFQGKEISEIAKQRGVRTFAAKILLDNATKELRLKILESDL